MSEINFFAKTNFRNQERTFGIKEDDRRRHMYVIGKTGVGKSNLLENMAIQDIRNGKGVCFVDPHGEGAEKMLKAIPKSRINDVIYFNPADTDFPIAFNILESVDEDKKNLVASGMMGVFKKIWPDVWSPRMEYTLSNTILALLDYPGSTMLGVNRMMFDKDYRKKVYPKIKDPVVKSFWINEFDKWDDRFRKEAVAAIQNKVGQFLSSSVIRHIVGQPKSTIDMRDIMDNQKILIVNLSKGRIGEDAMRLLGGMIVTKIQLGAMGRVDTPEEDRKDFYLYVDEFQNFATESFANILSEARKYRLNLVLAHQYVRQLIFDNNTVVRDAVFGNVGTIVAFRVGAEDAEALEKEFDPVFLMNDLVNLAKYHIYLKLMIDGIAGDAFSAITLPPADLLETEENMDKVIKVSRERYGNTRADVEDRIARWSGMMELSDYDRLAKSKDDAVTVAAYAPRPVKHEPAAFVSRTIPKEERTIRNEIRNNVASVAAFEPKPKSESVVIAPKEIPIKQGIRDEMKKDEKLDQIKDSKVSALPADAGSEKPMFEAVCDTCEEKILVPFKPDPSRPTFCKECLKDYQRAKARAQKEDVPRRQSGPSYSQNQGRYDDRKEARPRDEEKKTEPVVYVPQDKPISLNQVTHMSPKKFKPQRKRPDVDISQIRELINKTRPNEDRSK